MGKEKHIKPVKTRISLRERFFKKVEKKEGCWGWTGAKDKDGYGVIKIRTSDDRKMKMSGASRVSWQLHFGEIPKGMFICHKCDNPPCTNPDHLFLGTPKDNVLDMMKKERRGRGGQGEQNGKSKLTEETVKIIRFLREEFQWTEKALSKRYGVSQTNISDIILRKRWKHVL